MSLALSESSSLSLLGKGSSCASVPQEGKITNNTGNKKRGMAYNNVRYEGKMGKLIFSNRRLSFQPRGDKEKEEELHPLVRLSWEDVGFIEKATSTTAKRHKLKITSCFDNQILVFQTSNPDKLIKMYDEAHERLDEFHTYHEKKQEQLFINKKSTTLKTTKPKPNLDSVFEQTSNYKKDRDNTWNDTSLNWDEGSAFVTCSGGHDDDWNDCSPSLSSSPKRKASVGSSLSSLGQGLSTNQFNLSCPFLTMKDEDDASDGEDEYLFEDPEEQEDDEPKTVEIENVIWEGHPGRLVLQEDSVSFLEQDSKRCLFTLAWDKLRKHTSSASAKKRPEDHQQKMSLKLYVDDETYEAFDLHTSRERLSLLKQDMNRLQAAFLVNKIVVATPATVGTTRAAEKWQPDDHNDDATSITQDMSMSASDNTDPWLPCFLPSGDQAPSKETPKGRRSRPSSPKKTRGSTKKVTSPKKNGRRRSLDDDDDDKNSSKSRRSPLQLPLCPASPARVTSADRSSSAPSCFLPGDRVASPVASARGGDDSGSALASSPKRKNKGSSRNKDKTSLSPAKKKDLQPSQKQGGRHRLNDERSRSSRSSLRIPSLSPPLVMRDLSPTTRKATTTVATSTMDKSCGIADPDDIVDFFINKAEKLLDQHELEPTTNTNTQINDDGFGLLDSSTRRMEKLSYTTNTAMMTAMDSMKANYMGGRRSSLPAYGNRSDDNKTEEVRDDDHKQQQRNQQRRHVGNRRQRRSVC